MSGVSEAVDVMEEGALSQEAQGWSWWSPVLGVAPRQLATALQLLVPYLLSEHEDSPDDRLGAPCRAGPGQPLLVIYLLGHSLR